MQPFINWELIHHFVNVAPGSLVLQALVLAPTRELAQQIEKVMRALGDYLQVRHREAGSCRTVG